MLPKEESASNDAVPDEDGMEPAEVPDQEEEEEDED